MKKILAIVVLAIAVSASAFAQPKAIGGRFGYSGLEVDYQHYCGSPNFFEFNLGADFIGAWGFKASAIYNITFAQPNWTSRGDWAWYAGVGLSSGYVYDRGKKIVVNDEAGGRYVGYEELGTGMGFMLSIPVQVGLSYTFWFPLQLSVDIRPYLGMHIDTDHYVDGSKATKAGFYDWGLWGFTPTLSVHYAF